MHRLFYIAVIIMLVAVMATLLSASPQQSLAIQLATVTPFEFPTSTAAPTATLPLTPQGTSAAPGCVTSFPIDVGDMVIVRSGVNIRATPSVSGPLITMLGSRYEFTVMGEAVCADNYVWWPVSSRSIGGWVAERNNNMDFILNYTEDQPCAVPVNVAAGEKITLLGNMRIRATPSLDGRVLTIAPEGYEATMINTGAVCVDGYIWREVSVTVIDAVYEGWMAESLRIEKIWREPEATYGVPVYTDVPYAGINLDCASPMALSPGYLGRVTYRSGGARNMRVNPGFDGEILYTLVRGVPLEVTGGPVCIDGLNWWQVRIMSNIAAVGWMAEGRPGDYWIERF
jgi:hypothetical protein